MKTNHISPADRVERVLHKSPEAQVGELRHIKTSSEHPVVPLRRANGLVWLQSRHLLLSAKLLKVGKDMHKVKYVRGKVEVEVTAKRFVYSDWFSSTQLTFMGGTAAVKANAKPSVTSTYVLNK